MNEQDRLYYELQIRNVTTLLNLEGGVSGTKMRVEKEAIDNLIAEYQKFPGHSLTLVETVKIAQENCER